MLLNLALLFLNINQEQKYSISQEKKDALFTLLNNNDITLKGDYPLFNLPMRELALKQTEWDLDFLKQVFFGDSLTVRRTVENSNTIFKDKDATLTIKKNESIYESLEGDIFSDSSEYREKAIKSSNEILKKMGDSFRNYRLDTVLESEEKITLNFYEVYDKFKLFCNYASFSFHKSGFYEVSFNRLSPINFVGLEKEIVSSDEALFAFLQHIKETQTNSKITIDRVEIGYSIRKYYDYNFETVMAKPYYKLFTSESETPYMIDAYENEVE